MHYLVKISILTGFCCLCFLQLKAQSPPMQEIDLETFIEDLFAIQDDDLLYEDLYETLYQLYSNPIDINAASFEELSSLYSLSPGQVENIISYRRLNGPFLSLYELQAVPLLDMPTINKILPFVSLSGRLAQSRPLGQRIRSEKNNYFILRTERSLQLPAGYSENGSSSRYLGSPFKQYARFRVNHAGDFSFGFTMEKDAGERLSWNANDRQYGFDFYSFHGEIKNQGRWKSINTGDYQLQMGQGLVFGSGYGVGKGGETILTVKRNTLGLRPYTSVLETGFFRGAAATYAAGRWEITVLASRLKQDGNVQTDSLAEGEPLSFVSGIQNTGFHRTPNEMQSRNQIEELNTGATVVYKTATFQAGMNSLFTHFSTSIEKRPSLYNQFEFSGKNNHISSLHFSKLWQNTQFFGEAARSSSGGIGAVGGMLLSVSSSIGVSVVGRSYDRDFHSFYARAFGEASRNINEKGIYWGFKWQLARRWSFTSYYDHFFFPWLRFNADAPSQGFEYMGMATYNFSKSTRVYGQYRQQVKAVNGEVTEYNVKAPVEGKKENFILNLDHDTGGLIKLKSRAQLSRYRHDGKDTRGFALVQDINLKWKKLKIGTRMALFDSDDHNNRQYVYEKDVLYAFSIPSYSGQGIRSYFLLQYKMSNKADIWLRWSRFTYSNVEAVASGLQKTEGPIKSDLKIQLMISLF